MEAGRFGGGHYLNNSHYGHLRLVWSPHFSVFAASDPNGA